MNEICSIYFKSKKNCHFRFFKPSLIFTSLVIFAGLILYRVLLFPPLPSHYRFLIHKAIEECDPNANLCSLSVGKDEHRRTMIYYGSAVKMKESAMLGGNNNTIVGRGAAQQLSNRAESEVSEYNMLMQNAGSTALRGRNRRPDKQLYVPKAKRLGDAQEKDVGIDVSPQQGNRKILTSIQQKQVEGLNKENNDSEQKTTNASSDKCKPAEMTTSSASKLKTPSDHRNNCAEPTEIGVPEARIDQPNFSPSTNNTIVWHNPEPVQLLIVQKSVAGDVQLQKHNHSTKRTERNSLQASDCLSEQNPSLVTESPTTGCVESRSPVCTIAADEVEDTQNKRVQAVIKPIKDALTELDLDLAMQHNGLSTELLTNGQSSVDIVECILHETNSGENAVNGQLDDIPMEEVPASHRTIVRADPCEEMNLSRSSAQDLSGDSFIEAEDSWDTMYDENGECLDESVLTQLTSAVGDVSIEVPQIDYLSFQAKEPQISDEDFGHVVELYNFPVEFKTEDLMSAFSQFKDRGFNIKWVNDTHALAVFSSRMAAEEALMLQHPIISTRPLSQGIKESKSKARRCAEFLQPYKPRPETSALLARRLVAGALGVHLPVSKQERDEDRRKLREAKERKRLAVKQREEAWEGIIGNDQ